MGIKLDTLLADIRRCEVCAEHLPLGPRPIVSAHRKASLLIIGQAPGKRVHESGIPWNDPSGDRLREWLNVDKDTFYDSKQIALVPMGFCYPGTGSSGDLPPRKECAELWHEKLLASLPEVKLTLLMSTYAQAYYLGADRKKTLTDTVRAWREYTPAFLPLPHPSPRNNRWLKKNSWFEGDVLPYLRRRVRGLMKKSR
jgi:uracil-DNA glycosylase